MWPDSAVKYFKDALPADILEGVRADAEALSHTDNFWIPKVRAASFIDSPFGHLGEQLELSAVIDGLCLAQQGYCCTTK